LEYICVFEYTSTLHLFPQTHSNLPLYKMKRNNFYFNVLPRLYSNIICKNIVKLFQKFEMGYIQTCTPLESNIMWHPNGGHYRVFSPSSNVGPNLAMFNLGPCFQNCLLLVVDITQHSISLFIFKKLMSQSVFRFVEVPCKVSVPIIITSTTHHFD